jgi:hypothetical protein
MVLAYYLMAAGALLSLTGLIVIAFSRNALHHTARI